MITNNIKFDINKSEKIILEFPGSLTDLFRYDEVAIIYTDDKKNLRYIIYRDFVITALRILRYCLDRLFKGELSLQDSIVKDLGYLHNQRLMEPGELEYEISDEGTKHWGGEKYRLWGTPGNQVPSLQSWLYEQDNKIFFEITPSNPWNIPTGEANKKDIDLYKQFMDNYKPLVVTTIDRETLLHWFDKINQLLPVIEANDSKYFIKK